MNSAGAFWASWALAAVLGGCRPAPPPPPTVTIGQTSWTVELANTQGQRYQGLSDRPSLPAGRGMLFVYPGEEVRTYCMRRCLIPLDIAFINSQRRVVWTHTMRVEPYGKEEMSYSSHAPAQFALEVNAGELAKAGVKQGDQVVLSAGVGDPAKAEEGP